MISQFFLFFIFNPNFIIKFTRIQSTFKTKKSLHTQNIQIANNMMKDSQHPQASIRFQFEQQIKQIFNPKSENYFSKLLHLKGNSLFGMQTSHVMVMYFIIQGLASTDSLKKIDKQLIISYIKSLQLPKGGFGPSSLFTNYQKDHQFNLPHIVFTYSAVNILKNLDALHVIDKQKCLESVRACFKQNGSFSNFANSNEADLRFVYAGLTICHALKDFSGIDKEKVKKYIASCFNYDGGYGLRPYCESHCGAIYCAVSSYKLLEQEIKNKDQTLHYLVNRQTKNKKNEIVGVQGRVGKLPDSCYTFWVGASIKIICKQNLLNENIAKFLQICCNEEACNFSKYPYSKGDPLHTLHSTVGLKILREQDENINLIEGTTKIINE